MDNPSNLSPSHLLSSYETKTASLRLVIRKIARKVSPSDTTCKPFSQECWTFNKVYFVIYILHIDPSTWSPPDFTLAPSVFFLYVTKKSVRETIFWDFFHFFHVQKVVFTHEIYKILTHSPALSRALLEKFSRMGQFFSRAKSWKFSRKDH